MTREVLHGPTEADRLAVHEAAARRGTRESPPPRWAEDEALALASADRRNRPAVRALTWLAWAYNRSPLRVFLEMADAPLLVPEGVLPPLWRWLGFLSLPADRAAGYRLVARGRPERSSGWPGCLVVLPVWAGIGLLTLWALLATL